MTGLALRFNSLTGTVSLSGRTTDLATRTGLRLLSWSRGSINQVLESDTSQAVAITSTLLKAGTLTVTDITTPTT